MAVAFSGSFQKSGRALMNSSSFKRFSLTGRSKILLEAVGFGG
jgi:hypothetical protein